MQWNNGVVTCILDPIEKVWDPDRPTPLFRRQNLKRC